MEASENVGGRDRLARVVVAVGLTIAAIRSLRSGKRARGLLAGAAALVFGVTSATKHCPANEALGIDTSTPHVTVEIGESGEQSAGGPTRATTGEARTVSISDGDTPSAGTNRRGRTLTCAACGEPIVPGQGRGPDENDDIVHDRCQ